MNLLSSSFGRINEFAHTIHPKMPNDVLVIHSGEKISNNQEKLIDDIGEGNCVFYIGTMYYDENGDIKKDSVYNEELIEGIFEHVGKKLKKGKKITIKVATSLGYALDNINDKKTVLPIDEQYRLIRKVAYRVLGTHRRDKINICGLEHSHRDLIRSLSLQGDPSVVPDFGKGIASEDRNKADSSEIASLLFRACQDDNQLKEDILSTKIGEHGHDYYSLYEIAIRMSDYLNGEYIQGTTDSSKKVNTIFLSILQGKKYTGEGFVMLQEYIEGYRNSQSPEGGHQYPPYIGVVINRGRLRKYNSLLQRKTKEVHKLIEATTLAVSLILAGVGGVEFEKQRQADATEDTINSALAEGLGSKSITTYFKAGMSISYSTEQEKLSFIRTTAQKLSRYFVSKYGEGNIGKKELELFFILEMIDSHSYPYQQDMGGNTLYMDFIDGIVHKPRTRTYLIANGFQIDEKYGVYTDSLDSFRNTYNDEEFELSKFQAGFVINLGPYLDSRGNEYQLGEYKCDLGQSIVGSCSISSSPGKKYIVARTCDADYCPYSAQLGREVALDFLSAPFNLTIQNIIHLGNRIDSTHRNFFNEGDVIRARLIFLVETAKESPEGIKGWGIIHVLKFLEKEYGIGIQTIVQNTIALQDTDIEEIIKVVKEGRIFPEFIAEVDLEMDSSLFLVKYHGTQYFLFGHDRPFNNIHIYKSNFKDAQKFAQEFLK